MSLKLIDDGYTLDATTKPIGRWPAVTIKYRPAMPARVRQYLNARAKAGDDVQADLKAISSLLVDQIGFGKGGWDILTPDGQPAPVNHASVARLPDPVLRQLIDIVTGYGPEEAAADEKNSDTGSASS